MANRSVSQLNTFTRCGEAYRLERTVKGLPSRPAAWTAVGSAFHRAYEGWERAGREGALDLRFAVEYDKEIKALKEQQPDLKWWMSTPQVKTVERDIELRLEHGIKQAAAYQESTLASGWKLWTLPNGEPAIEVGFSLDLGGCTVRGMIDSIILWPDGQITVRDIKTGAKGNVNNRQLGLYRLAIIEIYKLDVRLGEYWYTKLGKSGGWVDLSRYTREYLHDQYLSLDFSIANKLFLANPGNVCGICAVKPWCREEGHIQLTS